MPGSGASKATPLVGVVGGSRSDFPILEKATAVLEMLEVPCELRVVSAHRTPDHLFRYAETAAERGIRVIIAGAGGAAHLPGMLASKTTLPVIGVPIPTSGAVLRAAFDAPFDAGFDWSGPGIAYLQLSRARASRAAARADATSDPSAVTWPIFRRSKTSRLS